MACLYFWITCAERNDLNVSLNWSYRTVFGVTYHCILNNVVADFGEMHGVFFLLTWQALTEKTTALSCAYSKYEATVSWLA